MNRDEIKNILLLYRPGTADADDPQIAAALARAKADPELDGWLAQHGARQLVVADQFRQIAVPAGLREQIISEQAAAGKIIFRRPKLALVATVAGLLLAVLALFLFPKRPADDTLAVYQKQMIGVALRGYAMDLATNAPVPIRAYLGQNHAPADFVLPAPLQHAELTGCAVAGWQNSKVAMICFRRTTSGPSDLWLFVVDRASVKNAPAEGLPQIGKVNRLMTATWTQGGKIYLLGVEGDEQTLKEYL